MDLLINTMHLLPHILTYRKVSRPGNQGYNTRQEVAKLQWLSPENRVVLTDAGVRHTDTAVLWVAPCHNSARYYVRVAISLPEIVSDEKITPLHLTSLVILHNNCRTTTSNQTEPHLQESNTGLKTPNPTAD